MNASSSPTERNAAVEEKTGDVVGVAAVNDGSSGGDAASVRTAGGRSTHVPLRMKIISVLLVTAIGFGSHWSSGVTGAMKSTLKKVRGDAALGFCVRRAGCGLTDGIAETAHQQCAVRGAGG